MSRVRSTVVRARANIALIKYWGKRDAERNLPDVGSLSLTLDGLVTETRIEPDSSADPPRFELDDHPMTPDEARRIRDLLDRMGRGERSGYRFRTVNHFPTAAGLASSASGGAAAVLALKRALEVDWDPAQTIEETLRVSGSAPRSLFGGFVRLDPRGDGVELTPMEVPEDWDLRVLVVQTETGAKAVSSRDAMTRSRRSPYYEGWVSEHPADLDTASAAIEAGDFDALVEVMEYSTLKMHALPLTCRPPVWYWRPATLAVLESIRSGRDEGLVGGFTMDAGPHVKVFTCGGDAARAWRARLERMPEVRGVLESRPGAGPAVEVEGRPVGW